MEQTMVARGPQTSTGIVLDVDPALLRSYLDEDLGDPWLDVTTDPVFSEQTGAAAVVTREPCVVSGIEEALVLFQLVGAEATALVRDGDEVPAGARLVDVQGPVRALLRGERTVLNVMARMSGVATLTRRVQTELAKVQPTVKVAATRKTTPGFRLCEKRAVWHGGGDPHRFGLWDQALIKDNHRSAGGDLAETIRRIRAAHPDVPLEVEVETEEEAAIAAREGVAMILVDNQGPATVGRFAEIVHAIAPEVRIEASGGITPENAADYAPYADRVSLGALTRWARSVDIGLDWVD
ncbi:MAG: carboxylating nicotinate-nucleotide diphosphorylase [Euryarchaeota archaeon]|nr:carboxylating nicotinate-nucleotide diphosphorylase [Euryarchaeota archaeon]